MEARDIEIAETIPASRKLQRDDAVKLLKKAKRVAIAKGKKVSEFTGAARNSDEAVTAMLGSTGNLRAPAIVAGDTLLVGFNEDVYAGVFG